MQIAKKTIVASFGALKACRTAKRYQYDYGQVLIIKGLDLPERYEVHFSDSLEGSAVTVIGDENGAEIPNKYFRTGENIYAWLFLHDDLTDGRTMYTIEIPIIKRAAVIDEPATPEQETAINQAIAALNWAVDKTATDATSAENAAGDAEDSAVLSESWAIGGTGTRAGEDANNSKFWAMLAKQGAEKSGFVWFDVRDEDGQMYVTITEDLADGIRFEVNETTGELEVHVA